MERDRNGARNPQKTQNRIGLLTRTILLSSSGRNLLKYERDKSVRSRVVASAAGFGLLGFLLAAFCLAAAAGFGYIGLAKAVPGMCASLISLLLLVTCFLRAGGILFSPKDYELLIPLPFTQREIVTAKFLAMVISNLPLVLLISVPMLAGYGYYARPPFFAYCLWVILSLFLPLIPMALSSLVCALIARIGVRSRHKVLVQAVLSFIIMLVAFSANTVINMIVRNGQTAQTLRAMSGAAESLGRGYPPVRWFAAAVTEGSIGGSIALLGTSLALSWAVFWLISRFYGKICAGGRAARKRRTGAEFFVDARAKSPERAVAEKELRRLTSSAVYLTNMGMGQVMTVIFSVLALFFNVDRMIAAASAGATEAVAFDSRILLPAVPLVLHFLVNMAATSAVSYSLEGNSLWIVRTLPISPRTLFRGKMLCNLWITVPFMALGCVCFGFAFRADLWYVLLMLACGISLCLYATVYGMYCNARHPRFDWEKEIEVIKQGISITLYLLPNLLGTMALGVLAVWLGIRIGAAAALLVLTALALGIGALFSWKLGKVERRMAAG